MEDNGIEVDTDYIRECDNSLQGGYKGFKDLYQNHKDFTAIFTANHYLTMGVLTAANEMGIKIPDDISLVAFDYMQWYHILPLKLTVVEQPMQQIGQHAAEIMLRRLSDSNDTIKVDMMLSAKIRIGDSIKPI